MWGITYKIKKDTFRQILSPLKICNVSFIFIKCFKKGLRLASLKLRVDDPKFFCRQFALKYDNFKLKNINIAEPAFIDNFCTNKLEINGKLKSSTQRR